MFRGKESSNRIKLSLLVQDLLNFGVLGSLQLWGGGRWVGEVWEHGGVPTHVHTHVHTHTHTHTHTHVKKLQMATNMFIMIVVSSPSSPCCPCCPHIIPVMPTSSLNLHLIAHPRPPGGAPNQ